MSSSNQQQQQQQQANLAAQMQFGPLLYSYQLAMAQAAQQQQAQQSNKGKGKGEEILRTSWNSKLNWRKIHRQQKLVEQQCSPRHATRSGNAAAIFGDVVTGSTNAESAWRKQQLEKSLNSKIKLLIAFFHFLRNFKTIKVIVVFSKKSVNDKEQDEKKTTGYFRLFNLTRRKKPLLEEVDKLNLQEKFWNT